MARSESLGKPTSSGDASGPIRSSPRRPARSRAAKTRLDAYRDVPEPPICTGAGQILFTTRTRPIWDFCMYASGAGCFRMYIHLKRIAEGVSVLSELTRRYFL